MNYLEFRKKIKDFPLVKTNELKVILGDEYNKSFLNNLLNWEKAGYLIKIRKGLYFPSDLAELTNPIAVATKIYYPSYVSLETALSYYGIIPEAVFTTTSVTTRKTKTFKNDVFGTFSYQKIKKEAYGGFNVLEKNGVSYNMATPEKSIIDFLYLNRNTIDGSDEQFDSYRFNEDFKYNKREMLRFANSFENKKTSLLVNNFIKKYVTK